MRYFDLQVNGYAGVDFNADELSEEALERACAQLRADGVEGILATIITDSPELMCSRLARISTIRQRCESVAQVVQGFHIEGPFLNEQPGYLGAHPAHACRPADLEVLRQLLHAADGLTRIFTLAPERDPGLRATRLLADQGICVSAGHCNPTLDELKAAVDSGLSMFTHLGNGCPLQLARHDNIIQRVLYLADRLWIGLIADGVHVPFPALKNYLRCASFDRCFVVTDAISAAGLGPGTYTLGNQAVIVDECLATWSSDRSHLMGSASTMPHLETVLREQVDLSSEQIAQLVLHNPKRAVTLPVA